MDHSIASISVSRPSTLGRFAKGALTGAINGALMMGIFFGVGHAFALAGIMAAPVAGTFLISAAIATVATGLFSGLIAAKDAIIESPGSPSRGTRTFVPVPAPGLGYVPAIPSADVAPMPAQSWASRIDTADSGKDRIQHILDNGALSDKGRAAAILADREAAPTAETTR